MKILVVSDTHGRYQNLERALKQVGPIDLLIHLGDIGGEEQYIESIANCPVEMVSGNNDFFSQYPRDKFIQLGKYYIMLTHGHRYGVNYGVDQIKETALLEGADIVMFGHTHYPLIDLSDEKIYAINPGSITQPRQVGHKPSFIMMELDRFGDVHFTINYMDEYL